MTYRETFKALNSEQREAVETIDGPLLVIAGPGTGKTQLLSVRVAHILDKTDTLPNQILCLTFTESGVRNMRERLTSLMGDAAYDVRISTYHAFGQELLLSNPDYSSLRPDAVAIDDLKSDELLRQIIQALPYSHLLKKADFYLGDLKKFISDSKRAALTPADINQIAKENLQLIKTLSVNIQEIFQGMRSVTKKELPRFEALSRLLSEQNKPLAVGAHSELLTALAESTELKKTTPLTKWKNRWLEKDKDGQFVLAGKAQNLRLLAMSEVYESYQQLLEVEGYYDYDDMILRSINTLEENLDFLYTLQERFQYFLLDEFQDTNASQLKLVDLLTNNPVHEGRPNIMAVGDDDQAIFAFQGATYSNMREFIALYRDTKIISLKTNYRSHPELVKLAHHIGQKVETRLHHQLTNIAKNLEAHMSSAEANCQELHEFSSSAAHYAWITEKIKKLIDSGVEPEEIAILAPQHKYFEPLLPLLRARQIPLHYEKKDNLFNEPFIQLLLHSARLVIAIGEGNHDLADSLWPMILSHPALELEVSDIWQISWLHRDDKKPWLDHLMQTPATKKIAEIFFELANLQATTRLEDTLDYLIGTTPTPKNQRSPYYDYYFGTKHRQTQTLEFWSALTALRVIRRRLADYTRVKENSARLHDLLTMADAYEAANLTLQNTSPLSEGISAVQIMTAYKAKGLEFDHVFIIAANDEVWGAKARGATNKLSLPPNLEYIRYSGASYDERARLLYVAMTRAKRYLYVCAYDTNDDGSVHSALRFLVDDNLPLNRIREKTASPHLLSEAIEAQWTSRHINAVQQPKLKSLLQTRLQKFRLSATHLTMFTDLLYAGPQVVLMKSLLRFPEASSAASGFGNAVHETLYRASQLKTKPSSKDLIRLWQRIFLATDVPATDRDNLSQRGTEIMQKVCTQMALVLPDNSEHEVSIRSDNFGGLNVRAFGKIDCLTIDNNKDITIIDYKTGSPFKTWQASGNDAIKAHRYKTQLMFYKLLIESSPKYANYHVRQGRVIFLDSEEEIKTLDLDFSATDLEQFKLLIGAVWRRIHNLDFPDTSKYDTNLKGINQFEADLINLGLERMKKLD